MSKLVIIKRLNSYINYLKHKKNPLYPKLVEPSIDADVKDFATKIVKGLGGVSLYGWGSVESNLFRRTFHVDKKRTQILIDFFFDNKQDILAVFNEIAGQEYNGSTDYLLDSMFGFTSTPSDTIGDALEYLTSLSVKPVYDESNGKYEYCFYGLLLSTMFWEILKFMEDDFLEHHSL